MARLHFSRGIDPRTDEAILLLTIYGALYTSALVGDNVEGIVNVDAVLWISFALAATFAVLSISAAHWLSQ